MGRKRIGIVEESLEELQSLAGQYAGTQAEARVSLLLALKGQPDAKAEVLTGIVGFSERTLRRWWNLYRAGGIGAIIGDSIEVSPICSEASIAYCAPDADGLMHLLRSLPTARDFVTWRTELESALGEYLTPGVEVTIEVSGDSIVSGPIELKRGAIVTIDISDGSECVGKIHLAFHNPLQSDAARATRMIRELNGFLFYLLSDALIRMFPRGPEIERYTEAIMNDATTRTLSPREKEILWHRLHGKSYLETAKLLSISHETVHKHIRSIYIKANVASFDELFAQYFTAYGDVLQTSSSQEQ